MKTEPLRIGIIGAGRNTRERHLPGLRALSGIEIAAVANRSAASGEAVAREFGIGRVARSWREIVEDPKIDAVVVGTWPNLHAEATIAALEAGKHVLTEARMAASLAEAEAMLAAAKAHPRLVAQIVPAPVTLDLDATVAEFFAQGRLGRLREISLLHTFPAYADEAGPMSFRLDQRRSGINTLTVGIYYETLRRWLGMDPVEVAADAAIYTAERAEADGKREPVTVPESLSFLGRYRDGTRLIGHFSGVERGPARAEFRIHGRYGSLRIDAEAGELWHADGGGSEQRVTIAPNLRRGWRVEADFIGSIRDGAPVRLTDFESGVAYMRFTDAVRRAANAFEKLAIRL